MRHLTFTFAMLALAAVIAAIWRPDYVWQCGLTGVVLLLAAAVTGSRNQVNK